MSSSDIAAAAAATPSGEHQPHSNSTDSRDGITSGAAGEAGAEPFFTIECFSPAFACSWKNPADMCVICRNAVEGPCVNCQGGTESSAVECRIRWGECGHPFHHHCLHQWLLTRNVCPLDNQPWKDKEEWNRNA